MYPGDEAEPTPEVFLKDFMQQKGLMPPPDPDAVIAELKTERIPEYRKIIGVGIPSMEITSKERYRNYYG